MKITRILNSEKNKISRYEILFPCIKYPVKEANETRDIPNRHISKYESKGAFIRTKLNTVVVNNICVTLKTLMSILIVGLNFL